MGKYHRTKIMAQMAKEFATFVKLPPNATPHTKGVRYLHLVESCTAFHGAIDTVKEGQKYKKRIIVRPSRFRKDLHELYTYHFPKHWSAGCIANREIIKEAQRRAHALEHDRSLAALDWYIRFYKHYFNVFKGSAKPEPGLKPYSRFYQYTFVVIYRQLKAEAAKLNANAKSNADANTNANANTPEDITFEPVIPRPFYPISRHRTIALRAFSTPSLADNTLILLPKYHLIC